MTQCDTCQHDGMHGGVLFPPVRTCEFLETETRSGQIDRLQLVLARFCQQAAEQGKCPAFECRDIEPDSYRSEDLPRQAWLPT